LSIVITGSGISEFVLRKKAFILPLQVCNRFCVTPLNYEVQIHALSHEKLAIKIHASLTIGPNVEDRAELNKYVRLLVSSDSQKEQETAIRERVTGNITFRIINDDEDLFRLHYRYRGG
jgi:flotillin